MFSLSSCHIFPSRIENHSSAKLMKPSLPTNLLTNRPEDVCTWTSHSDGYLCNCIIIYADFKIGIFNLHGKLNEWVHRFCVFCFLIKYQLSVTSSQQAKILINYSASKFRWEIFLLHESRPVHFGDIRLPIYHLALRSWSIPKRRESVVAPSAHLSSGGEMGAERLPAPLCLDTGPSLRSWARGCGISGANLACVLRHTPRQTSTPWANLH